MSEVERILDQLQRAYNGDAWHGPSLCALLDGVSAEAAVSTSVPNVHSIWEIVLHITTWKRIAAERVETRVLKKVPPEVDWSSARDHGEKAWQATLQQLQKAHDDLCQKIRELQEPDLQLPVKGSGVATADGTEYTLYILLHGVIQHDLYHAGQIAVLKKALR
jgi:uncharacterized damage-inducible protein DinB